MTDQNSTPTDHQKPRYRLANPEGANADALWCMSTVYINDPESVAAFIAEVEANPDWTPETRQRLIEDIRALELRHRQDSYRQDAVDDMRSFLTRVEPSEANRLLNDYQGAIASQDAERISAAHNAIVEASKPKGREEECEPEPEADEGNQ